jgi:HTH-type transcriptional regulator/antitoxin HigA
MEELDGLLIENHTDELADEVDLLQLLVEDYEEKYIVAIATNPAEILKILLKEHQITANEISKEFGVSKSIISEILSNKRSISKSLAVKIANKFKIRLESLIV